MDLGVAGVFSRMLDLLSHVLALKAYTRVHIDARNAGNL